MDKLTDAELSERAKVLSEVMASYGRFTERDWCEAIARRLGERSEGVDRRVRPLNGGPISKGGQNIPDVDADGFVKLGPRPPAPQGSGGSTYRQSQAKERGE